jgi:hypothetical protein
MPAFCALPLFVVAGGCTDAMLSPDAPTLSGVLREERTSPVPLAAPFPIPVPASNGVGVGGTEWVRTHFVIPEGEWAHVQVTGGVSYTANPNCYYASGPCNRSLDGMTTGPLFHGGASHVRVGYQVAGQPAPAPHGSMAEFGMYAVGGSGQTAMESAVLVNAYRPFQLWVRRVIVSGGTWDPFSGSSGAQYFLADAEQRLKVTIIPTPLRVGGPETVEPGKPAQFTAEIVGPFQFRRQTPWGDTIQWQYYPGDTLPEPNPYLGGTYLYECTNQPTCSYTPKRNGRMGVNAQVQYNVIGVRSAVVRIDSARLELKCNGAADSLRITRADNVRCEASGATDILGWSFQADSGGYRNPPHEGSTAVGARTWEGRMVLGGTVTVRAQIAGREESKSVRVGITAREWSSIQMPRNVEEQPASHLSARPDSLRQLGDIHQWMSIELNREKWEPILTGPNANLAYLVAPPATHHGIVHVNRTALSVGSDFWNAQYTRQRSSGVVDCLRREQDIVGFIPVVLRHEGIGLDPKSHVYLYAAEADRVGNPRYEAVVGTTMQELAERAETIMELARDSAVIASARADSAGYRPPWCQFHFNYGGR